MAGINFFFTSNYLAKPIFLRKQSKIKLIWFNIWVNTGRLSVQFNSTTNYSNAEYSYHESSSNKWKTYSEQNNTKIQNNATKYFSFQVATLSVVQIIK
jgi:hypothetical protein